MDEQHAGCPDATAHPDLIRTALLLAARAPSVHNSQPWRWRVESDPAAPQLHLFVEPDLNLPSVDPDGRGMILSCGAALHHCVVAFAALGQQVKVRRLPDAQRPDHLAAIELAAGGLRPGVSQVDVALAAAIPRRRTDRRCYSGWPVAAADIALMGARAARSGVMLRRVDALDRLNAVVARAVFEHRTNYEYLAELATWSGRYGSVAGVPARSVPVPDTQAPIPGRFFAGPALAQPPGAEAAEDRAVMLALGTEADDRLAQLRAGEATSVVLLTATALGLASCPVTEPLEIAETRAAVRRDVFGTSGYPQMLLRVGWAPINADPLPATPRRSLNDTVQWQPPPGAGLPRD
ncbi:Acg family FMN-binding oxidoreductase [Mycolicibacter hiberniae]|uniref:Acg family FMN-binding oxidoreductase n=1 Tax=Mycolicibacter hiberniae TaxID=29314 RepID=UPI000A166273|nr:nitroreductase family protein [Mycolicibacter hiberniae]MCV7085909.1 nitroreductase family protein [Mycolicibacter hiberniae]ORV71960.1 NAD(P)H nitroreductase [Mycolicibacter hiberniae]